MQNKPEEAESALTDVGHEFDPFELRDLSHPTSDLDTLIHMLKVCLGSGILAMPYAFSHTGLTAGIVVTILTGFLCSYGIYLLVKSAHTMYRRLKVPCLGYADVAEAVFLNGPPSIRKFARASRVLIDLFLVASTVGICCTYVVFVSGHMKQVVDYTLQHKINIRLYMVALLPFLLLVNFVRRLKYLVPFSIVSNLLIATVFVITAYYVFQDLPPLSARQQLLSLTELPVSFSIVVFAIEGIGIVMPLENNMKTPQHFISCPGVLCISMTSVVTLYTLVGFFGYLKYGGDIKGSITLNLPDEPLAQVVKVLIALAIFLTYALQFYVPIQILWEMVRHLFTEHPLMAECGLRALLVTSTVCVAMAIPDLGPFISLIGAVCLSTLGLIFPPILDLIVVWESPGLGRWNWHLWKNALIILFGVVAFFTGFYCSVLDIIRFYETSKPMFTFQGYDSH